MAAFLAAGGTWLRVATLLRHTRACARLSSALRLLDFHTLPLTNATTTVSIARRPLCPFTPLAVTLGVWNAQWLPIFASVGCAEKQFMK